MKLDQLQELLDEVNAEGARLNALFDSALDGSLEKQTILDAMSALSERRLTIEAAMTRELNSFVIHPFYTGRDKGAIREKIVAGDILTFRTEGEAWWHIFFVLQPNDPRAKYNYRVRTLIDYLD